MYHLKCECLYGGRAQIFYQLRITYIAEKSILTQDVKSAASIWNPLPICFGNVLLHKMFGPFCRGQLQKCSNVAQDILMLFRRLVDKLSQQELERWAMMIWAMMIWAMMIWAIWNA